MAPSLTSERARRTVLPQIGQQDVLVYPRDEARFAELLEETRHLSRLVEDLGSLAHGGDIRIESTPGQGTEITVSLPR